MTKNSKQDSQHQTKAGLMHKNGERTDATETPADAEKDEESTPKISKDQAEHGETDRPAH